jgi:L-rhamnose 1-dehydrogenase
MELLAGKVAVVTGGVTGIGRAIALEYVKQGASVVVNHLGDSYSVGQVESMMEEVGWSKRLIAVSGDVSKPQTAIELVEKTVQAFGKLDIFVSNAGICQFADFLS